MNGATSSSSPKAARSRRWLAIVLVATLTASAALALVDDGADTVVAATAGGRRVEADHPAAPRATGSTRVELPPRSSDDRRTRATASPSWPEPPVRREQSPGPVDGAAWGAPEVVVAATAPPTAVPAPAPPAEPVVPAFPYTLIGRLDDGRSLALLSGPMRSLSVGAGDVIDGQWRVDAIRDEGITLTWLPGGQQQQLGFRAS